MNTVITPNFSSQSFEGSLYKSRNLLKGKQINAKFNKVAEMYEDKTPASIPDINMAERVIKADGENHHYINFVIGNDAYLTKGSISVPEEDVAKMFTQLSDNKITNTFINLAKRAKFMIAVSEAEFNLKVLAAKLEQLHINAACLLSDGDRLGAKRLKHAAIRIEERINSLKEELSKNKKRLYAKEKAIKIANPYIADYLY